MNTVQIKAERTVDLAAAHIREAILTGELPVGSFLPAERTLAASLGINRLTLRAALARLESEGLVRPEHGKGVLVLDYHQHAGIDLVQHLRAVDHVELVSDFLALRRIIAAEAVVMLCRHHPPSLVGILEALAEAQQTETDLDAFAQRDIRFARELVRGTGNVALELLVNSLERVCLGDPALVAAMHADRAAVRRSYPALVALIQNVPPDAARPIVHQALEAIDQKTLKRLKTP